MIIKMARDIYRGGGWQGICIDMKGGKCVYENLGGGELAANTGGHRAMVLHLVRGRRAISRAFWLRQRGCLAASTYSTWQTVVGLEVHAQLAAQHKLFSPALYSPDARSNTLVEALDMATPGSLPVRRLSSHCTFSGRACQGRWIDLECRVCGAGRAGGFGPRMPGGGGISF